MIVYDMEIWRILICLWWLVYASGPVVGLPCQENIDCQTVDGGATCSAQKRCACLGGFVNINNYCWRRISPGQTGCQYTAQCEAVWPGTICTSAGVCVCSNNQPPHPTKDGPVCILDGLCPTNGPIPKLRDAMGIERQCGGRDDQCLATLLYDCICNPTPSATGPGTCTGVSYCCPSRGWTCAMPSDQGRFEGGILPSTRYFFNSVSGRCEPFIYRGTGGNANNFLTEAQCQSYCTVGVCGRGNSNYDGTTGGPYSRRRCSPTRGCGNGFQCGGNGFCCPSNTNICGSTGGVIYPAGTTVPEPDPGQVAAGITPSIRYYYDDGDGTCRPFTYNGVGGNFNNFFSEAHCRQFCSRTICNVGEPLRGATGDPVTCPPEGTEECPRKYECNDGYCCPTADFVCRLDRQPGACSSAITRYAYDQNVGDCVSFVYSGCQGNMNNFASYDACMNFCKDVSPEPRCPIGKAGKDSDGYYMLCGRVDILSGFEQTCPANYFCYNDEGFNVCCPSLTQTCLVDDADPGTTCITGNRVMRWYYNSRNRICETFRYNGCDGNSNNFATRIDCEDYCRFSGCPDHGQPYSENGRYRTCSSVGSTSFDCPANYACTSISLPFSSTLTNRGFYCCPTRAHTCSLPRDSGTSCGTGAITRYYYNSRRRACESFQYNGCGGNDNNFPSSETCTTFCQSAGCPFGQVAMTGQGTNEETISCDVNEIGWSTCSSNNGFCVESQLLNSTLCCGSNAPVNLCPAGQRAYVDSLSNRPLQCAPNLDNCPVGYSCNYDPVSRNSYCCGIPIAPCPDGSELLTEGATFLGQPQPRQCTPDVTGSCPNSYYCQPITITVGTVASSTGHCCSLQNPCGAGYMPYRVSGTPVACNSSTTNCPSPYECLRGTCCAVSSSLTNVCPAGRQPLYRGGAPTLCIPSSTFASCSSGYTCDLYSPTNVYYCCGQQNLTTTTAVSTTVTTSASAGTGGCPADFRPVIPLTVCSPNAAAPRCPGRSFCTYDPGRSRFICCFPTNTSIPTTTRPTIPLVNSICPRGRSPAIDLISGRALACSETFRCPRGYSCVYSPNGDYCCSYNADAGCPNDTRAYMYTWSNTPLACLPNSGPRCPEGYTCARSTITRTSFQCCTTPRPAPNTARDGCPVGTSAYLYVPTRTPLVCVPNGPACPSGYSCTPSTVSSDYRCCTTPPTTTAVTTTRQTTAATTTRAPTTSTRDIRNATGCPAGSSPYLFPNSELPLACHPNGPACPRNYRCVQSTEFNGTLICCRSNPVSVTTERSVRSVFAQDELEVEIELSNGALAGEPCVSDEECRNGAGSKATCRNGFCICASNEVNMLGVCTPSGCPSPYRNVAGKCVIQSSMQLETSSEKGDLA